MSKKTIIKIEFDTKNAAMHFAHWLCGSGEQDYWQWMECREQEEKGNITVKKFHYYSEDKSKNKNDESRYGKFMVDNIIRTTLGRITK